MCCSLKEEEHRGPQLNPYLPLYSMAFSECQLIRGLQQQDHRLFQALNQRYAKLLYWNILKIIPDRLDAQDILQESLLKIWQNGHRLDTTKGTLLPWILSIARHAAIDYIRSKTYRKQQAITVPDEEQLFGDTSQDMIYYHLDQSHLRELLGATLEKTPLLIMQLIYFQNYTHQEVAKELSLPLGTVKTHTRRSLKQLRDLFLQKPSLAQSFHPSL